MTGLNAKCEFIMAGLFASIITGEMSDRVRELRFSAARVLQGYLRKYSEENFHDKLLIGIAEKKSKMIMEITTKSEMDKLLNPQAPRYDGNKFISNVYLVPEEELICWSKASLRAPLNEAGFKRYMELFKQVLPEESKKIPEI